MSLSEQLRQAIQSSGRTIYAVSKESGVPYPVVYRFLKGERTITLVTADKLADYFGLELRPREKQKAKRKATRRRRK